MIFTGTGATSASNLLINKLNIREICASLKFDQVEQVLDKNYCKQNRWMSYDCTLCKVIMPSLGSYEQHRATELHIRNV